MLNEHNGLQKGLHNGHNYEAPMSPRCGRRLTEVSRVHYIASDLAHYVHIAKSFIFYELWNVTLKIYFIDLEQ